MAYSSSEGSTDDPVMHSIMPNTQPLEWDGQQLVWVDRPEGRDKNLQFARERKPEDPPCGSLMWEKDGISYVLDGQNLTLEKAEEYYRSLKKAKDI